MHCCASCMRNASIHGSACEKVIASIYNTPIVPKVIPDTSATGVTVPEVKAPN